MNQKTTGLFFRTIPAILVFCAAILSSGCASRYIPPSGRADLAGITTASMQESFAAKPEAKFPAYIAIARIQSPQYQNYYTEREGGVYGQGRYSVVTVKEDGEDEVLPAIGKLPEVGGITGISTMLLPTDLKSDRDLREAAARLKADMLLLYTFDTSFHENENAVALSVVTLGLSPTHKISVHVTASALLIDTRTGFVYATLEANENRRLTSNIWESSASADRARQQAEKTAFTKLIAEFEKSWPQIVQRAKQGA